MWLYLYYQNVLMFCLSLNLRGEGGGGGGRETPEQRKRRNSNLDAVNNSRIQDNTHSDEHTIFHPLNP